MTKPLRAALKDRSAERGAGRRKPLPRRRRNSHKFHADTATVHAIHTLDSISLHAPDLQHEPGCDSVAEPRWAHDEPVARWFEVTTHPSGHHASLASEATTYPAVLPNVQGVERIELPYRERFQDHFGEVIDHLEVFTGLTVAESLAILGAEAASHGRFIFLNDPGVTIEVVAHEVVHALQSEGLHSGTDIRQVLEPGAFAEYEADEVARKVSKQPSEQDKTEMGASVSADTLALRRNLPLPTTPPPGEQTAEDRFAHSLQEDVGEQPSAEEGDREASALETAETPAQEPGLQADGALDEELTAEGDAQTEEPQPTFELPQMPDTELSPEEQAARQAELEAAGAAIAQAEDAGGVMDAFADAPPSVKAARQADVSGRIAEVVQNDKQQFESDLPEFRATMGGDVEAEDIGEVAAPEAASVELESGAPPPAPEPDLPPEPTPNPYRENDGLVGMLSRMFGGDPADAVGRSLQQVQTTDPDINTSAGEAPGIALEGETDPERIENQHQTGIEEARLERQQATQAVLDGPGPERARLKEMDEAVPMGELVQPQIEGVRTVEGAQRFNQMQLPEEVSAQFDRDMGETMQAGMAEARDRVNQAESDRDQQREQAVQNAEMQHERLVEQADTEQRAEVTEARRTIQSERQNTVDAQAQSVRDIENGAETERARNQSDIQNRVREDERQISDRYAQAERDAEEEVQAGERQAEEKRRQAEREAEEQSWWDRAVNFVKQAFAALAAAINVIFDAVRDAVKGILDAVRDLAKGLIDLAADFIKGAIEAFGELLKGLVDTLLGDIFPELAAALTRAIDDAVAVAQAAVDVVANWLKQGVDALVNGLQAAIDAVLDAFQGAINFALSVMQAALSGDWGALAMMVLEAALRVLGIDPAAFYAFVGRALETINIIIDDPGGFLGNLVDAVVLGFQKFADRFLTHLQAGIIGWLTGALGDIQIPARFDLLGLLDLARQILGITWDWIRTKAVRIIGEENVQRIEFMFSYIQTLIEGGFAALFQRLMDDLSGLVDTVLDAIKSFLVEKVIIAGITWLASLFNPVGALVKLLFTIWNLYQFLRDQLARIFQVVQTVVEGLGNIARGVIEGAAGRIEQVLANLLPIAIDLVAKLLGLTGIAARVRGIIGDIRDRVDRAVDSLIHRVLQTFRGAAAAGETGDEGQEARLPGELEVGEDMRVPVEDGPDHLLTIDVRGLDATVMLASDPLPVRQWLDRLSTQAGALEETDRRQTAELHIQQARQILDRLDPQADQFVEQARSATDPQNARPLEDTEIDRIQGQLRDALRQTFEALGRPGAPILDIFRAHIDRSHRDVRNDIGSALQANEQEFQTATWEQVKAQLQSSVSTFQFPLRREHAYGKNVQDQLRGDLAGLAAEEELPVPENVNSFISNNVVRQINNSNDEPYMTARRDLQAQQFEEGDTGALSTLRTAVKHALRDFSERGDRPDEDLVEAVSGQILPFLKAVASGESGFRGLDLGEWERRLWGKTANRNWIKDRFRGGGGYHEWIPTNYVNRVVERARQAADSEGAPTAVLWIDFQDQFRTRTNLLMYPPEKDRYRVTVPYTRNPQTLERDQDGSAQVLQGHVGAVYAPVRSGQYSEDVIAQTKGQGPWHDDLRQIFDGSFGIANNFAGMRAILSGVDRFIQSDVWFGDGVSGPVFNEYYARAASSTDPSSVQLFTSLQGRAKGAAETVENDFERARGAVGM
jgi:hypothetical protein